VKIDLFAPGSASDTVRTCPTTPSTCTHSGCNPRSRVRIRLPTADSRGKAFVGQNLVDHYAGAVGSVVGPAREQRSVHGFEIAWQHDLPVHRLEAAGIGKGRLQPPANGLNPPARESGNVPATPCTPRMEAAGHEPALESRALLRRGAAVAARLFMALVAAAFAAILAMLFAAAIPNGICPEVDYFHHQFRVAAILFRGVVVDHHRKTGAGAELGRERIVQQTSNDGLYSTIL
jgi:hypothetical protein